MPEKTRSTIHQLRVSLSGSRPSIWRSIQVPSQITLPQLHLALQVVMGWENYHLHEFKIAGKVYAEPDPEDNDFGRAVIDERRVKLDSLPASVGSSFEYRYDFGDDWDHEILIESISLAVPRKRYPVCVAGARSGPPEDVGGIFGYLHYLDALFDPRHEDHRRLLEWRGRFDPEYFVITSVNKALREAFPIRARKASAASLPQSGASPATFEEDPI